MQPPILSKRDVNVTIGMRAGSLTNLRGGLELGTGTGPYGACRSTQCCVAVWYRWVESSTRLGGFRALKKTPEAPYTTKVNYRGPTSRGTTSAHSQTHTADDTPTRRLGLSAQPSTTL